MRAQGADAATFLHGQLSQDVLGLAEGELRLAAYCSPKGRMLASLLVWRSAADAIDLACHASVLEATLKRLRMFVLRARCRLEALDTAVYGLVAPAAALSQAAPAVGRATRLDADGGALLRLPDVDEGAAGRPTARLLVLPGDAAAAGEAVRDRALGVLLGRGPTLPAPPAALDAARWQRLWVKSAVPWISAPTVERFVPQMVNFELVGGVHFQKGCYPGQEVVARAQYRGSVKRRMFRLRQIAGPPPAAGSDIVAEDDPSQPAGTVVLSAPAAGGDGAELLAELRLGSLQARLHAGSADGPLLQPLDLPYPLPAAEPA